MKISKKSLKNLDFSKFDLEFDRLLNLTNLEYFRKKNRFSRFSKYKVKVVETNFQICYF